MGLMARSLLSPKDGAPRTTRYFVEGYCGRLLAGAERDTPVAMLAHRRKSDTRRVVRDAHGDWCGKPNQWSTEASGPQATRSTGIKNRTSGLRQESRPAMPVPMWATASPREPERARMRRTGVAMPALVSKTEPVGGAARRE